MTALNVIRKRNLNLRDNGRINVRLSRILRVCALALLCCLFLPACTPPPAPGSATVTEATEAALDAALAKVAAGGGKITFACDGTIPITHTKNFTINANYNAPLTITLDATGHNVTFDGGGTTAMFAAQVIATFPTSRASWKFMHLNFTRSSGSAVSTYRGDVTASDCAFSNGGNVAISSGSGTFTNCTFTNNQSATAGGAVTASGAVTLSNCAFTSNQAKNSFAGAVNSGTTVTASGCVFTNNQAAGSGGAIFATTSVTLSGCVFGNNTANGPAGTSASLPICNGGAVYSGSGVSTIANCAFINNRLSAGAYSSVNGGAVMLAHPSSSTITNCTFTGNSATAGSSNYAHGGAIYCNTDAGYSCTLINCTVANNSVKAVTPDFDGRGGGIFNGAATLTLVNTIVADNRSDNNDNVAAFTLVDGGHNLCSDGSCAFASTSTSLNNTDPRLGPLVYPGNATPTLSLLGGSPAIDTGDDSKAPATDQRGASVQGAHRDIGAYERPGWQADAVATDANNDTLLLWNHNQGYACLWRVDSRTGAIKTAFLFGPYAGWTSLSLVAGSANAARILWKHVNGQVNVWNVDTTTGAILSHFDYPAEAGWTGAALSVGGDGNTRLAWSQQDGRVRLWTLEQTTGARISDILLTPPSAGSFADMATGSDNLTRVLWNHVSGVQSLSNVDSAGNVTASYSFGPVPGWTASRLSVGGDRQTRMLWNHVQGYQGLWSLNSSTGVLNGSITYGSYPGWNSLSLATGRDNTTRLLWNHSGGQQSFWNVDNAFNILIQPGYGPY